MAPLRHTFSRDREISALDGAADDTESPLYSSPSSRRVSGLPAIRAHSHSSPALPRSTRVSATAGGVAQAALKLDHEGLSNVPTGPRRHKLPFIESIRFSPHLSIAYDCMPGSEALLQRLQHFFSPAGARTVIRDAVGYYIVFAEDAEGKRLLDQCFRSHDGVVFSQKYRLRLTCHVNGLMGAARTAWLAARHARAEGLESHYTRTSDGSVQGSFVKSSPKALSPVGRPASPMSSTMKRPQEDTSSVVSSSRTQSSATKSRRERCFVCKQDAAYRPTGLVQCSTCTKQYHHSCHNGTNAPTLGPDHFRPWSCNSCVRKRDGLSTAVETTRTAIQTPSPSAPASAPSATESRRPAKAVTPEAIAKPLTRKSGRVPVSSSPRREADKLVETSFAAAPIAAPTPKSWTGKLNLTRKKLQQTPDRTPTLARQHGKIVQAGSVEIAHDTYLVPMEAASKSPVRKKGTAVKTVDAPADSTYVSPAAANSCSKVPDSAMEYGTRHPDSVDTKSARPAMAKRGGFKGVLGKRAAKISTAVPRLSAPPSRVGGAVSLNTSISQGTLSSGADNPDEMPDLDKPEQRLDAVDVPTKTQRGKPLPLRSHVVSSADLLPATEDPTSAEVPRSKPTLPSMNNDSTIPASVSATQAPAWTEEELARIKDQLGDSHKRPRRTARFPLVGMALASATRHRLQSIGVNKWVADNIPTYKLGEGDWENSLTALLSTGQSRGPNLGYWRQHEWTVGSGGIGTGCWWELLPGKIDEMWQWDAQRKQPIQPRRALSSGPTGISTRKELLQHTVRNRKRKISSQAASSLGSSCADTPLAERLSTPRESVSTRETPSGDQTSSEEEPIMMKRRKLTPSASTTTLSSKTTPILVPPETKTPMLVIKPERPPRANMIGTKAANGERPAVVPDSATVRWSTRPVDIKPRPLSVSMQDVKKKPVLAPNAEEIGLATYIAQKAPQLDFSARSLFSEWPEYHPSYVSNSTTSSIRLTRKQLFRKPACYSRLEPFDLPAKAESPVKRATVSPEKRPRAIVDAQPDDPYPWEEEGTDDGGERREVESFEQLLGLSEDPVMKILCEGDLAFREEVRMESGRLARGQGVYMTGYGA